MKQIFEWLREEIEANSVDVSGTDIIGTHRARCLINTAESMWEKDCCEWKKYEADIIFPYKTSCGHSEVFFDTFKYCPYCGKPIKIVEVE